MKALFAALVLSGLAAAGAKAAGFRIEHLSPGSVPGIASLSGVPGGVDVVAEMLGVQFSSDATTGEKSAALAAVAGVSEFVDPNSGWVTITLSSGASVVPALSALAHLPGVLQAVPNRVVHFANYPSDPGVAQQYSLTNTDAFAGWDYDTGGSNLTTVVVIDSGIDFTNQPDLSAKRIVGKSVSFSAAGPFGQAASADDPPTPSCGHATEVASAAAASANNGIGIAGVSWGAKLVSIRIFDAGCGSTSDFAIANGINYVSNTLKGDPALGNIVVNLSVGGAGTCGSLPKTETALATLVSAPKNIPIAIAAGNYNGVNEFCTGSGTSGVATPADCAGVAATAGIIPVGATNSTNNVATFSCQGPELAAHGVSAPGDQVLLDALGGGTVNDSGTSFSSPFVAGTMALMLSAKPTLTPAQLESYLRGGANSIGGLALGTQGNGSGAGQVNVFRSMRLAVNGTLAGFDGDIKVMAFPNPFRPAQTTLVSFGIPPSLQSTNTQIKIYTVNGQLVRQLTSLVWDGKNANGTLVASGTYIFEVKSDAGHSTGRLAVIR